MTATGVRTGVAARGRAGIGTPALRADRWWLAPLTTAVVLGVFIVYTTVRLFMRDYYYSAEHHYLTPLYSPCLSESCVPGASHFGQPLPAFPVFIPFAVVFPILAAFRLTCYYYRKAYYRAYFLSPPGCAVPDARKRSYSGESRFPMVLQNTHRYIFYAASVVLFINLYDLVLAFDGEAGIGVGLGNVIMLATWVTLAGYTLGCHSCRHAIGGRLTHFSRNPVRYWIWTQVSRLNARHMHYAWISLVTVIVLDAYIMSVSAGWFPDLRFLN